jgi:hypothetical protein
MLPVTPFYNFKCTLSIVIFHTFCRLFFRQLLCHNISEGQLCKPPYYFLIYKAKGLEPLFGKYPIFQTFYP